MILINNFILFNIMIIVVILHYFVGIVDNRGSVLSVLSDLGK